MLCMKNLFPEMPCMKRAYKDKSASVHWSAARNEESSWSRLETADNCWSNAVFVPLSIYIIFSPGHFWDEKGLQRQGGGLLVGIKGTKSASRPGDKPRMNRL